MNSFTFVPMKPLHKNFFSSLKQVEKRLKLDDGKPPPPPSPPSPPPQTTETQPSQSSTTSSPLYFNTHHTTTTTSSTLNSISQPPQEFLSYNETNDSEPNPSQPQCLERVFSENNAVGDIDMMIKALGLSDFDGKGPKMPEIVDDEFYDKIVKVKGVKCKKEVERLDGWIKYFLNDNDNGGKVLEPFRLAHLVLAKAAFVSGGGGGEGDGDGDGLEFPSTVDQFLQNDPPSD